MFLPTEAGISIAITLTGDGAHFEVVFSGTAFIGFSERVKDEVRQSWQKMVSKSVILRG